MPDSARPSRTPFGLAAVLLLSFGVGCSETQREATPPDCGSYEVSQSDFAHASSTMRVRQECLIDAFRTGAEATLSYRYPTEEGDPITVRYEVTGKREVVVQTDMTKDRFLGGPPVTEERCTRLEASGAVLTADNCARA